MILHATDFLIILMPFSEQYDHISRLGIYHAVSDCFFSVVDLDILSIALCQSDFNIVIDITDFFVSRIIAGQYTEIRHLTGHLSHIITAQF